MAAGLLLAASLAGTLAWILHNSGPARAVAGDFDIEVQRHAIDLTIFNAGRDNEPTLYTPQLGRGASGGSYSADLDIPFQQGSFAIDQQAQLRGRVAGVPGQGMALVKDRRMVLHLKEGDNLVKFTDVAATIDPTSVRLVSETDPAALQVVEQNFEFDLATADALLKRYIERRVACIGKDEQAAAAGFLVSYDADTIVLADRLPAADPKAPRPKTQSLTRRALKAIRLEEVPKDLYVRPTLVWKLRAKAAGDHLTTLTYLCGNVVWQADYVATITKSDPEAGDLLDLTGWVTIDNRSGTTYERSGLKLIAGDVNRVRDPWAPWPHPYAITLGNVDLGGLGGGWGFSAPKEFIAKDFFEYKLYTLNLPSTVRDREIKQLGLLRAAGIKAERRYVYDSADVDRRFSPVVMHPMNRQLATELIVKNDQAHGLGRPLPKGRVTFVGIDADGESHFLGRDQVDHTPKDETLLLKLGAAFDVVGEFRIVTNRRPSERHLAETYEIVVRNHKDVPINVRAIGHLNMNLVNYTNWQVAQTTDACTKHDFETLYFDFRMKPDSEKKITYTVDYEW
jgi:hypothetical protein